MSKESFLSKAEARAMMKYKDGCSPDIHSLEFRSFMDNGFIQLNPPDNKYYLTEYGLKSAKLILEQFFIC